MLAVTTYFKNQKQLTVFENNINDLLHQGHQKKDHGLGINLARAYWYLGHFVRGTNCSRDEGSRGIMYKDIIAAREIGEH
jgi:hypothetical protein